MALFRGQQGRQTTAREAGSIHREAAGTLNLCNTRPCRLREQRTCLKGTLWPSSRGSPDSFVKSPMSSLTGMSTLSSISDAPSLQSLPEQWRRQGHEKRVIVKHVCIHIDRNLWYILINHPGYLVNPFESDKNHCWRCGSSVVMSNTPRPRDGAFGSSLASDEHTRDSIILAKYPQTKWPALGSG